MIRIILSGCFGKMGHVIRDCVSSRNDCEIVAGVDIGDGKAEFPVFKSFDSISGVDAEALDELRLLVVVDLASDEGVCVLLAYLVEGRGNAAAVGAPLGPEIHQHGLVRMQDVIFKAVGRNGKHRKILLFLFLQC